MSLDYFLLVFFENYWIINVEKILKDSLYFDPITFTYRDLG